MKYKIKVFNIWEQGPREKQEDSMFPPYQKVNESDRLFILCDGMGGHSAGEIASNTVCQSMSESIFKQCPDAEGKFSDDNFRQALSDAFDELDTKDNGAEKKMGTTLTFLKFHEDGCTIAHIGDSRVYHIRSGQNVDDTKILFQTADHSLVNDLIRIGELTPEEAKHSKQKNVITRAMQPHMERRPKADIYHSNDIKQGDYFMLCSDGILEHMEDDNIKYIFSAKGGDDLKKVDMLIKATNHNHDNHSAIIIHVIDVIDPIVANADNSSVARKEPELLMGEVDENEGEIKCNEDKVLESSPRGMAQISTNSNSNHKPSIQRGINDNFKNLPFNIIYVKIIVAVIIAALLCWGGYSIYLKITKKNNPSEIIIPPNTHSSGQSQSSSSMGSHNVTTNGNQTVHQEGYAGQSAAQTTNATTNHATEISGIIPNAIQNTNNSNENIPESDQDIINSVSPQ